MHLDPYSATRKMFAGFAIMILLFCLLGGISLYYITTLRQTASIIHQHPLQVSNAALRASLGVTKMHRSMKDVTLLPNARTEAMAAAEVKREQAIVLENLRLVDQQILGPVGKELARETQQLFADWQPIRHRVFLLIGQGAREDAARITQQKGARHVALLEAKMLELTSYARAKADGFLANVEAAERKAWWITVFTVASGVLLALLIAYYTIDSTQRAIRSNLSAQRQVIESENRYRSIVEHINDGLWIHDRDGVILDASAKAYEPLGYTKQELVGLNIAQITSKEAFARSKHITQKLNTHGVAIFDSELMDKLGNRLPVSISATLVPRGEQNVVQAFSRDISELKKIQQELESYNERLEETVDQRTSELKQAHKSMLRRERLAALGQLTGTVAHELRNPLGTIRGSVFTIAEQVRGQGGKVDRALQRTEKNIQRCDDIIQELLDFAREPELRLKRTDMDSWLRQYLSDQQLPAPIELALELNSSAQVSIDRERMRRCLTNVLSNACEAMLERSAVQQHALHLTSQQQDGRFEIVIADTGGGIPDTNLNRIFEPLFSTKSFGVGLGLPLVQRVMEQHLGGVEISNRKAGGTKVVLWVPSNHSPDRDSGVEQHS